MALGVTFLVLAAWALVLLTIRQRRFPAEWFSLDDDWADTDEPPDSGVREPIRPNPSSGTAAAVRAPDG